jgi:hypothetical protein
MRVVFMATAVITQVFELHHEVQELGVVLYPGAVKLRVLGIPQVADDAQLHGLPPLRRRTYGNSAYAQPMAVNTGRAYTASGASPQATYAPS